MIVPGSDSFLDGHCGNDSDVLAAVFGSRHPVSALLGLGWLRQRLEPHDLADEDLLM